MAENDSKNWRESQDRYLKEMLLQARQSMAQGFMDRFLAERAKIEEQVKTVVAGKAKAATQSPKGSTQENLLDPVELDLIEAPPGVREAILRYERAFKKLERLFKAGKPGPANEFTADDNRFIGGVIDFKPKTLWSTLPPDSNEIYSLQDGDRGMALFTMIPPGHSHLKQFGAIAGPTDSGNVIKFRPDDITDPFAAAVMCYCLVFAQQFSTAIPAVNSEAFLKLNLHAYFAEAIALNIMTGGKLQKLAGGLIKTAEYGSIRNILRSVSKADSKRLSREVFEQPPKNHLEKTGRNTILMNAMAMMRFSLDYPVGPERARAMQSYIRELVDVGRV